MRNEELKLPELNYDELSIKSRFTALTANDQPPVGASIARPQSASFVKEGDRVSGGGFLS